MPNGSSDNSLTKSGSGMWVLSGVSSYGGITTISAGTLKLGANNVIPNSSALIVNGTFDLQGFSDTVGSLASGSSGTRLVTSSSTGIVTLTVGGDNTSTTYSGVIQNGSGSVGLTKAGTGTLTLSGNNTYSQYTSILAGTLIAENNNALGTSGLGTSIAAGATLDLKNVSIASESLSVDGIITTSSGTSSLSGVVVVGSTAAEINVGTGATLRKLCITPHEMC